ncbi:MAG: aminotransferase class I/II-fold pyridoxal phosphate-dependent enzyme [Myxococcales bacterium]|nr:aminotransferase class I/II-fold pyridoxal phosphate-dependent enzyme [Myxococcales bacterium]
MADHPFDAIRLEELRARKSAKWAYYDADVLPAWVAEMDYPLAEPISRALHDAIDRHDAGYAFAGGLGEAFATWAHETWQWQVAPRDVHLVADVVTGITELLRVATEPGDAVVIDPPVYPPFASTVRATGRTLLEAPLVRSGAGFAMDLDAVKAAYEKGARVHVLCSPHNPAGFVLDRDTLVALGDLAERYGVLVLSDEIHAPLTLPGAVHTPLPMASEAAASRAIVLTSASKSWNLAGLKAATMVGCGEEPRRVLARLPVETPFHAGHMGVIGACAAFREGGAWLAQTIAILDRNRHLLTDLLAAHLPGARYVPPQASYLAWIDLRELGLGDDPAAAMLEHGRVALSPGPSFGAGGAGYARLNIATTRALLEEAVARMAAGARAAKARSPARHPFG